MLLSSGTAAPCASFRGSLCCSLALWLSGATSSSFFGVPHHASQSSAANRCCRAASARAHRRISAGRLRHTGLAEGLAVGAVVPARLINAAVGVVDRTVWLFETGASAAPLCKQRLSMIRGCYDTAHSGSAGALPCLSVGSSLQSAVALLCSADVWPNPRRMCICAHG